MLDIKIKSGEIMELVASGTVVEILGDFCTAIHHTYESMDAETADIFKKYLTENIGLAFCTTEELDAQARKAKKKKSAKFVDDIDELIGLLQELKELGTESRKRGKKK